MRPRQRVPFSDTLFDLANVAAATLVLGQFVGQRSLSWLVIVAGVAMGMALVSIALSPTGSE